MNKQAKNKGVVMFFGIVACAILILAVYGAFFYGKSQTFNGVTTTTSSIISSSTALTYTGQDAISGAPVTTTNKISTNGGVFVNGITTASQGDTLAFFSNASGYHTGYVTGHIVPSKTTDALSVPLYANATITLRMFNSNNAQYAVATQNLTALTTTGASDTYTFQMIGQDQHSTNDMRCVLEESAGANVTKDTFTSNVLTVTPIAGNPKPQSYSQGANTVLFVFDVSPISAAGTYPFSITTQLASGKIKSAGSTLKITCDTKEHFLDAYNNQPSYAIEDSQGNLQSMNAYTGTYYYT